MNDVLETLYRTSVVLWVEDELTRSALLRAWGPTKGLSVHVAGRKENVRALARSAATLRVSGLVDRDFDAPLPGAWSEPKRTLFTTDGHEFENDLLDFDVIARVSANGTPAATIEASAQAHATTLIPSDPGVGTVADLARAADYVLSSPGWSNAPAAWGRWKIRAHVEGRIADEARRLDATLTDGSWREHFSGKEILRWVRGRDFGLDAMPAVGHARDANLALRVVRAMEDMGRIPPSWIALRDNLAARAP